MKEVALPRYLFKLEAGVKQFTLVETEQDLAIMTKAGWFLTQDEATSAVNAITQKKSIKLSGLKK